MTDPAIADDQFDSNRLPYDYRLIPAMIGVAILTMLVQFGLFFLMPEGSWTLTKSSLTSGGNVGMSGYLVNYIMPGSTIVWGNEVWVSVSENQFNSRGPMNARGVSSRLVAINTETGKARKTGIAIYPAPAGMLILDDTFWAVSGTAVYSITNDQETARNPRRGLVQPTPPFLYEGRMAVIDKNLDNVYTLLVWGDGEWSEVGRIDAPFSTSVTPWIKPELRAISVGKTTMLVYFDGAKLVYREGIELIGDDAPISALRLDNYTVPAALADSSNSTTTQAGGWGAAVVTQIPSGWKQMPAGISWSQAWDLCVVGDKIHLLISNNSTDVQMWSFEFGHWRLTNLKLAPTISFGVAGGPNGYIVNDQLQLFDFKNGQLVEHVTTGLRLTDRAAYFWLLTAGLLRYTLAMSVLLGGSWWLLRRYRRPNYLYGKRHVIQASILRRAIARGIDSLIVVYPPLFWLIIAIKADSPRTVYSGNVSNENFMLMSLMSIFGIWLGGILILGFTQGLWGVTPGKWLCGIRTFRTTLRPCGMLRGVAREMMVYVDSLFFLTWIPGVLSIAWTSNWQRLGDLVAETIVIVNPEKRSWLR